MGEKRQYEYTYGLLRILACFFVIFHHFINTNIQFVQSLSYADVIYVLDNFLMCNNGLFFLLSGKYALSSYNGRIGEYYKKKFTKIFVPFFLISLIYFCYLNCKSIADFQMKTFISDFISNNIMGYFWFIYAVLGFYLVVPFFAPMLQKLTKKEENCFIVILLCAIAIKNMTQMKGYNNILVDFPLYHMSFMLVGYFLAKKEWTLKREIILYILGTVSLVVSSIECVRYPGLNSALNDNCITRLFMCMAFFVLIGKHTSRICAFMPGSVKRMAGCTYDIYLLHYIGQTIFMTYGWNLWVCICKLPPVLALFIGSLCIFLLTYVISYLLKKIWSLISREIKSRTNLTKAQEIKNKTDKIKPQEIKTEQAKPLTK